MVRFNRTHSFPNLQTKFFNYVLYFGKFQQIMQIPCNSHTASTNYAKFAPFVNPLYNMFQMPAPAENSLKFQRITQILRNSPTTSANYAKFAPIIDPFTLCFRYLPRQRTLRDSSELCKFHAIRPQHP